MATLYKIFGVVDLNLRSEYGTSMYRSSQLYPSQALIVWDRGIAAPLMSGTGIYLIDLQSRQYARPDYTSNLNFRDVSWGLHSNFFAAMVSYYALRPDVIDPLNVANLFSTTQVGHITWAVTNFLG